MRNQNRDRLLIRRDFPDRPADFFFRQRIKRRSRLVEHQQLRMPQQRASDRKPLLLAA